MRKDTPPNLLIITADQLRYDCIGASGFHPVHTPNLDALSKEGVTFSSAYSHFPVCCPARQSLLNGRRPEAFGALWNFNGALPTGSLQPSDFTWTRTLAENGYDLAYLGKWGVHPQLDATAFGFDQVIGEERYREFRKQRYPHVAYTSGFFGEPNPIPVEDSSTHWFAGQASEQLRRLQSGGRPWHMALHFSEPHLPCRPSGKFATMYDPASIREWPSFRETFAGKPYIQRQQLYNWGIESLSWEDWSPVVARYFGIISQLDEAIGIVLRTLEETGAAEHTIVVFTADHGDMCGSHRMMDKHYVLYDDVVRVPLIVRLPGFGAAGARNDEFVYSLLDMAPTVLELLGLEGPAPGYFHGASFAPLLTGGRNSQPPRNAVVSAYNGQQFGLYTQRMIRTRRWKYIWNTTDVDELYDLERDPAELMNVAADERCSATLRELRLSLYERLQADGDPLVANEWMRRQLTEERKLSRLS
ncbi:sulfatase-like hydrolase/transferase [Paenibacillus thermotolerans]|uniref:sulfatase-like hydrolase/transferase n=1 Tax=Paenibacillus thermotolerans TaxID=3027807 RepID=UPI002368585F|nr:MULTISPECIES: sulfatase-like hydrolase/transferase [unclassified Paenibacillus]